MALTGAGGTPVKYPNCSIQANPKSYVVMGGKVNTVFTIRQNIYVDAAKTTGGTLLFILRQRLLP